MHLLIEAEVPAVEVDGRVHVVDDERMLTVAMADSFTALRLVPDGTLSSVRRSSRLGRRH
jgi:hypothetical protein